MTSNPNSSLYQKSSTTLYLSPSSLPFMSKSAHVAFLLKIVFKFYGYLYNHAKTTFLSFLFSFSVQWFFIICDNTSINCLGVCYQEKARLGSLGGDIVYKTKYIMNIGIWWFFKVPLLFWSLWQLSALGHPKWQGLWWQAALSPPAPPVLPPTSLLCWQPRAWWPPRSPAMSDAAIPWYPAPGACGCRQAASSSLASAPAPSETAIWKGMYFFFPHKFFLGGS